MRIYSESNYCNLRLEAAWELCFFVVTNKKTKDTIRKVVGRVMLDILVNSVSA